MTLCPRPQTGAALVIVLAFVVLLTVTIVAFFAQATLERQISDTSAHQQKASDLAKFALTQIIGEFRQEMLAGSLTGNDAAGNSFIANGVRLYFPTTNWTAVPLRYGANATLTNLVRRSVRPPASALGNPAGYDTNLLPTNVASAASSTNRSLNGRSVSLSRWIKPRLIPDANTNSFVAPDWVIVTRDGPRSFANWSPSLVDPAPGNGAFAIGRYSYVVYNQGALVDVNIAGFPTAVEGDPDFLSRRGRIAAVDINRIPGVLNGRAFVDWRNEATRTFYGVYTRENRTPSTTNAVVNPGFLNTYPGDQAILSRQDLLDYQKANPTIISEAALPLLGTFSRTKNAPSLAPATNRPLVGSPPVGNSGVSGNDNNFNPNLANLRLPDGTLRLKKRFPLSRLSQLTRSGPAPGSSADEIHRQFGLLWQGGRWVYTSPDSNSAVSRIELLKNIPGSREPDFFELLQAAILVGSLGRDSGPTQNGGHFEPGTSSDPSAISQNTYYQVVQIGANVIDQWDADSYPTEIVFGTSAGADIPFYGIEDLPYLSRLYGYGANVPAAQQVQAYLRFEFWNPHAPPQVTSSETPGNFRVVGQTETPPSIGAMRVEVGRWQWSNWRYFAEYGPEVDVSSISLQFTSGGREPFLSGRVALGQPVNFPPPENESGASHIKILKGSFPPTFLLQYQDAGGTWRTYQRFRRVLDQMKEGGFNWGGWSFPDGDRPDWVPWYHMRVDPRTDRFGTSMNYLPGDGNFGPTAQPGQTLWPSWNDRKSLSENHPNPYEQNGGSFLFVYSPTIGWNGWGGNAVLGTFAMNRAGTWAQYRDIDGTIRPGDAFYASAASGGNPMEQGGTSESRPRMLNRPFRSVGDLGYVFRDLPFKSLDFSSTSSADGGLLDVFTLEDAEVVAGRVDLNAASQTVLGAILEGAAVNDATTSALTTITLGEASAQAAAIRTEIANNGPFLNKADLLRRIAGSLISGNSALVTQREAAIRALAETVETRTWNLLIDVVAQSGRFPPAASTLDQFQVEGEKRYWLHICLDRYTGEVIEQRIEPVYE